MQNTYMKTVCSRRNFFPEGENMSDMNSFTSGDEKNKIEKGTLYLVSTPIGNLSDISNRALKVLSGVDFVAAEDTRNSGKMLSLFGIDKPFVSYHDHNRHEAGKRIVERLKSGETCALVTDAGTPAISDPGNDICVLCAEQGIKVISIPGACAAITALAVSALPTRRFVFEGFLPPSGKERKERLNALKDEERTSVIYEAPHRLIESLNDLYQTLGDRKVSICRELTKINEEVIRTTLSESVKYFNNIQPRGEYVLVLEGRAKMINDIPDASVLAKEVKTMTDMGESPKIAMKTVAERYGVSKNTVYRAVVENKENL